ncbi:hypothetical protein HBI47_133400 [Parastagonospora nodorum]|nr:hypothetical protein HBI47_133400 [Parastagonospora nodorum]
MRNSKDTASTRRKHLPDALYILKSHSSTTHPINDVDILAPRPFTWNDLTSTQIRSHLSSHSTLSHTSPFLSTHPDSSRPLACLPLDMYRKEWKTGVDVVRIDSRTLRPAWACMEGGDKVPIWVEQATTHQDMLSSLASSVDAPEPSVWICVDEVSDIFDLKDGNGEWLACGIVPARMICTTEVVTETDLDLWMEIAKRPSVIANRKAYAIAQDVVPERKSSLAMRSAVAKGKKNKREEVVSVLPREEVKQRKQVQKHLSVPTRPALLVPRRKHDRPRHLSVILEDVQAGENCELEDAQDLPPTDTAQIPRITITPPSLPYTPVSKTYFQLPTSAAILARLEDMQSTGAALKVLIEESRVKHEASIATSRHQRDKPDLRKDVWARNHDDWGDAGLRGREV